MQGLHRLKNFTLFYSEIWLLEKIFKWLQWDSNPQFEPSLAKWLSVCFKWLWVRVRLQSLKRQFFFTFKKFTLNSILGKIFEKICWISFIVGCGGYILIKSLWFHSTKSLELIGASRSFAALSSPGLCHGTITGYHKAPTPPHPPSPPPLPDLILKPVSSNL